MSVKHIRLRRRWTGAILTVAVLILGVGVTGVAYAAVEAGEDRYADQVMDRYSDEISEAVTDRVARYGDAVTDLAFSLGAQSELSADDFTRITAGLDTVRLTGVSAVAFLTPASTAQTPAVQRYWRAAGAPDLVLRPQAGQPEHQFVIFEKAFDEHDLRGVDVSVSEPVGAALRTARHSNALAISAAYPALRDSAVTAGRRQSSLMFTAPVYRGVGSAAVDEFVGWVSMGVRGQDFLAPTLLDRGHRVIRAGLTDPAGDGAVIAAVAPGSPAAGDDLSRQRTLVLGQRRWELAMTPTRRLLNTTDRGMSRLTAAAGAVLALLLATMTGILSGSRNRALEQVDRATAALRLDITRREKVEAQLHDMAFHDPLTGLANRSLFYQRLHQAITGHPGGELTFAVLFIDLDGFKQVNDQRGHQAGDAVLREVAARLLADVRSGDTVARFGGDEFAVLLAGLTDADAARRTAERVIDVVQQPIDIDGAPAAVSASVGIAVHRPDTTADDILRDADAAMYAAKAAGKNRYVEAAP